jgi:hypothetical protein
MIKYAQIGRVFFIQKRTIFLNKTISLQREKTHVLSTYKKCCFSDLNYCKTKTYKQCLKLQVKLHKL